MPLISIFMPSYNHEQYLSDAIESVLTQTFEDFELIIVDDCSTDHSRNIIKQYHAKDKRIQCTFHSTNQGIAKTLNNCLKIAQGTFIAFIASDDTWGKNKLSIQLKAIGENNNHIIWCEGAIIDSSGALTGNSFQQMIKAKDKKKSGNLFEELLKGNFILGSSLFIKKSNLGPIMFNENLKYLNDYQFAIDLASKYNFKFIPEPLVKYRIHSENTCHNNKEYLEDTILLLNNCLLKYTHRLSKKIKNVMLLRIGYTYYCLNNIPEGRKNIFKAISYNKFNLANIFYIIVVLTNNNKALCDFIKNKLTVFRKYLNRT